MASSAALDRNCAGMFVRCTSSTRSCSERRLSSRVVAKLGGGNGGKAGNGAAMTAKQKKAFKKEVVEAAQQAIMVGMKRAAEAGSVLE